MSRRCLAVESLMESEQVKMGPVLVVDNDKLLSDYHL
jgi:hypothetical protein